MLHKIFRYIFAKRKMRTLRHIMLRYVRVENRHKSARYVLYCVILHVFMCICRILIKITNLGAYLLTYDSNDELKLTVDESSSLTI